MEYRHTKDGCKFRRPWTVMEAAKLANKKGTTSQIFGHLIVWCYKTHHQSSLDEEASKKAVMVGLHFQGLYQYIRWKTL